MKNDNKKVDNAINIENAKEQIKRLQQTISYDTRDYPVEYLVKNYNDHIFIRPDYQRNELIWDNYRQARFIESLLLGYPTPMLFLSDTSNGNLEIVDGLQRISTLANFFKNDLILEKLEKLDALDGFKFDNLPEEERKRLAATSLRVIVLRRDTTLETRIDLFKRINTSSLKANDSEQRNGAERLNPLMQLIIELAKDPVFNRLVGLTEAKIRRKEDIELVSRFFAYSYEYKNFKHEVRRFITKFIQDYGDSKQYTVGREKQFKDEFRNTFQYIQKNYPENVFHNGNRINQTPRVRFEAIAVGTNLALKKTNGKLKISKRKIEQLIADPTFKEYTTSDASNSRNKIAKRIEYVENYLLRNNEKN